MDQQSCSHLSHPGRDLFAAVLVPRPRRSAPDMIPALRPVDIVMFLFYLVLLALGIVADTRNAFWFVPLGLSVLCAILWSSHADNWAWRFRSDRRHVSS